MSIRITLPNTPPAQIITNARITGRVTLTQRLDHLIEECKEIYPTPRRSRRVPEAEVYVYNQIPDPDTEFINRFQKLQTNLK